MKQKRKKKCITVPSERNREKLDAFVATFSDALIRSIDERRDAGSFAQYICKHRFGTHTIPNTHRTNTRANKKNGNGSVFRFRCISVTT